MPKLLGDGGHRNLVDVVEDQDGAAVEIELRERRLDEGALLVGLDPLVGRDHRIDRLDRSAQHFDPVPRQTAVVGGDPVGEAEEPGAQGTRGVILIQPCVYLEENFVGKVLEVGLA